MSGVVSTIVLYRRNQLRCEGVRDAQVLKKDDQLFGGWRRTQIKAVFVKFNLFDPGKGS